MIIIRDDTKMTKKNTKNNITVVCKLGFVLMGVNNLQHFLVFIPKPRLQLQLTYLHVLEMYVLTYGRDFVVVFVGDIGQIITIESCLE